MHFQVCELLRDPSKRLHEIEIDIGTAFKPMLAETVQISEIETLMKNEPFYIEVKYDGERMLAHFMQGTSFKFFSRNCHDFTQDFGATAKSGKFAYFIQKAVNFNVKDLDKDMVSFSKNDMKTINANKGDLVYIQDSRWWLGGLKSIHATFDDPHDENGVVYMSEVQRDSGMFIDNLPLKAEKEM